LNQFSNIISITWLFHKFIHIHVMVLHLCSTIGQQCCYDDEGRYITTSLPAGSADYYFPLEYYLQHQSSDYFPYKTCCVDAYDPDFCEKYYSKRPKDNVNGTGCSPVVPDRGMVGAFILSSRLALFHFVQVLLANVVVAALQQLKKVTTCYCNNYVSKRCFGLICISNLGDPYCC